jgi:surface polysaccharide O-acyltransferase-like enzyme
VVALALALASAWDLKLSLASQMLPGTVATMFIPYLGYYLAGYELRRLAPVRLHPGLLWGGFAIGAACTIVGTHALVSAHGPTRLGLYLYEYLSPNVILMSLAVFCLASRVTRVGAEGGAFARCIIFSAPLTLGIYVAHPMMILGLRKLGLTAIGSQSVMGVLLVALPAFAASLALTWTISRIPLLKRCVGVH